MIRTKLISVVPWEVFAHLQNKLGADLNDTFGAMEEIDGKEIWFGFVNHLPMRFTYRTSDHKATHARCSLDLVKSKLRGLKK